MQKLISAIAVAALAVAAFAFSAQDAAFAYCRGCATSAATGAAAAAVAIPLLNQGSQNAPGVDHVPAPDVSANHHDALASDVPENAMNSAACHTERQPKVVDGKRTWSTAEVCE